MRHRTASETSCRFPIPAAKYTYPHLVGGNGGWRDLPRRYRQRSFGNLASAFDVVDDPVRVEDVRRHG